MISCFIYSCPMVFSAVVFLEQGLREEEPMKRLLPSTLALILFACQAATDTLPPQSPQATTTTSVPVAEVATLPPFQTSSPDPTPPGRDDHPACISAGATCPGAIQ